MPERNPCSGKIRISKSEIYSPQAASDIFTPTPFRPYNHNILHRKELLSHNILNFTLSNKFPEPFPLDFFPQNNIVSPCCFGAGFSKVFRIPPSPPYFQTVYNTFGIFRVPERCPSWPKERDWKSRVLLTVVPRVRIPLSPP